MPTKATTVGRQRLTLAWRRLPPARSSSSVSSSARAVARSTMLVMPNLRSRRRDPSKGGEESRSEAAAVEGGPEAVAGAAEVAADGGGVEAGIDAGEENDEVFGDEIRDELVVRG